MPVFEPAANEQFPLHIQGQDRRFESLEHPRAPGFAHAMEGGKAFVYRVKELNASHPEYALKVMKVKHRSPALEEICNKLDALKTMPGLGVCERSCLSPTSAPDAIRQYKNLAYAILMPWVQGFSWFDVLYLGKQGQHTLAKDESVTLALNLGEVLAGLEAMNIAHCDLSGGNIILDPHSLTVELIDIEDIFAPTFQQPSILPLGTPGYQHKTSAQGQWHGSADRFAGAIILAEILGWHDAKVKRASYGETFFDPAELQAPNTQRFDVLVQAISAHRNAQPFIELLRIAWASDTLDACPPLSQWLQAIKGIKTGVSFTKLATAALRPAHANPAAWAPLSQSAPNKPPQVTWGDALKVGGGTEAAKPVTWSDPLAAQTAPTSKPVTWGDVAADEEEGGNGSAN